MRDPFRALVASLRADGLDQEAAELDDVLGTTFTSSSELLGEVGAVLTRIRQQPGRRWSAASTRWFHASMDAVHNAWPRI